MVYFFKKIKRQKIDILATLHYIWCYQKVVWKKFDQIFFTIEILSLGITFRVDWESLQRLWVLIILVSLDSVMKMLKYFGPFIANVHVLYPLKQKTKFSSVYRGGYKMRALVRNELHDQ